MTLFLKTLKHSGSKYLRVIYILGDIIRSLPKPGTVGSSISFKTNKLLLIKIQPLSPPQHTYTHTFLPTIRNNQILGDNKGAKSSVLIECCIQQDSSNKFYGTSSYSHITEPFMITFK